MHVAGAHQGVDVGFMGLRGHRVAQKHHRIDLATGQSCADLQVAAKRAGQEAFDFQTRRRGDTCTRRARSAQLALHQNRPKILSQRDDVVFLGIVGDQSEPKSGFLVHP